MDVVRNLQKLFLVYFLRGQLSNYVSYDQHNSLSLSELTPTLPIDDFVVAQTFDFIVVGGGVGGCTVAARLAESGVHSVLLIEAGGKPDPELEVPALSANHLHDPNTVIIYKSVPQQNAGLAYNGIMNITQGRVLGGSSDINGMFSNRGSPYDYDNWAGLTGDQGWSFSSLLPYFKRIERYTGNATSSQRGFIGPLTISNQRYAPGLPEWLKAGRELGYSVTEPNGPQYVSFTHLDYTRKNGRRVTAYNAYVQPLLQQSMRKNLQVLINTEVNRIVFLGNRAVGVTYTSSSTASSKKVFARARREVILAGGSFGTPAILLRSGVGPKPELEKVGVPLVKELPVGRNLHDHPSIPVAVIFGNRSAAFIPERDLTPAAWQEYLQSGDGPYTNYLGTVAQAFLVSSLATRLEHKLQWPDIQLIPLMTELAFPLPPSWTVDASPHEVILTWSSIAVRPRSRGTVTLDPRNIDGLPLIDFQYFTHPHDIRVMVEAIKTSVKICEETRAFQRVGCRLPSYPLPACGHLPYRSDAYWECYAQQVTTYSYHGVGTCRMGRGPQDPEAVVDSKLKVIGLEGLRVADASIMPEVINANTQLPVYVIGEKAADMILAEVEAEAILLS